MARMGRHLEPQVRQDLQRMTVFISPPREAELWKMPMKDVDFEVGTHYATRSIFQEGGLSHVTRHSSLVAVAVGLLGLACVTDTAVADSATLTNDTHALSGTNAGKNYGTATSLIVQSTSKTYLQFDLSTLPAGTTGNDVAKATLTLGVNKVTTAGSIDVFRVTQAWSESTLTWNTAPALAGAADVSGVPVASTDLNDFKTIDVTQLVRGWLNGVPNDGLALVSNPSTTSVQFDSKESTGTSHWPRLDISLVTAHEFGNGNNFVRGAGNLSMTGANNTGLGTGALAAETTGTSNTAVGTGALGSNTSGYANTAVGDGTLQSNDTGQANTALGAQALVVNSSGNQNTAVGGGALHANTAGTDNTAVGADALSAAVTGNGNTALGKGALVNNTGGGNIAVGANAGQSLTTGSSNIDIGNPGVAGESNTIRIGTTGTHTSTFVAGVSGTAVNGGAVVMANGSGQLGTGTVANTQLSAAGSSAGQVLASNGSAVVWQAPVTPVVKDSNGVLVGAFDAINSYAVRAEGGKALILPVNTSGFVPGFYLLFTSTDCTGTPLYNVPSSPDILISGVIGIRGGTGYLSPTTGAMQTVQSILTGPSTSCPYVSQTFVPPDACCSSAGWEVQVGPVPTIDLSMFTPPFRVELQ